MCINGNEAKIEDCMDVMGFVPQDDIVFAELTVKENLLFAGKFRLPRGTPLEDISKLAADVIADLGLSRVKKSMVGDVHRRGVSGGKHLIRQLKPRNCSSFSNRWNSQKFRHMIR